MDLEKEGIGAKTKTLMKNDGEIVGIKEIDEDIADVLSEMSEDAPGDSSADVSVGKVQHFSSDDSSLQSCDMSDVSSACQASCA